MKKMECSRFQAYCVMQQRDTMKDLERPGAPGPSGGQINLRCPSLEIYCWDPARDPGIVISWMRAAET